MTAAERGARQPDPPAFARAPGRGCLRFATSTHQKTRALAVELLDDWEAIFQVLSHLEPPLTNNAAERALRYRVILRKLGLGTRTAVGSRVVAPLASAIDTCRQRGHAV